MSLNTFRMKHICIFDIFDKINLTLEYSMHGIKGCFQEINGVNRKGNRGGCRLI